MTGNIRKHLEVTPFVPFAIHTADGHEYAVRTVDHIYLPPAGGRVVISDDEGVVVVLPGLMISGLVHASDSHKGEDGGRRFLDDITEQAGWPAADDVLISL